MYNPNLYPAGVPNPDYADVNLYPTYEHGPDYTRPVFGQPYKLMPQNVLEGLGLVLLAEDLEPVQAEISSSFWKGTVVGAVAMSVGFAVWTLQKKRRG